MGDQTYKRKVSHAEKDLALELQAKRVSGASWAQLETEYDLSRKTILRIFRKFDLNDLTPKDTEVWDRPCLRCGKKVVRPKGIWICMSCKYDNSEALDGMPPAFIGLV